MGEAGWDRAKHQGHPQRQAGRKLSTGRGGQAEGQWGTEAVWNAVIQGMGSGTRLWPSPTLATY